MAHNVKLLTSLTIKYLCFFSKMADELPEKSKRQASTAEGYSQIVHLYGNRQLDKKVDHTNMRTNFNSLTTQKGPFSKTHIAV